MTPAEVHKWRHVKEATGGPLAFTFGSWFTWTAVGIAFPALGILLIAAAGPLAQGEYESSAVFAATHLARRCAVRRGMLRNSLLTGDSGGKCVPGPGEGHQEPVARGGDVAPRRVLSCRTGL
jgi:hypothetical protein